MNLSDNVLRAFARGDMGKAGDVIATLPEPLPLKGAGTPERPWVVRTEREPTVEERLAALEERLARLEGQQP